MEQNNCWFLDVQSILMSTLPLVIPEYYSWVLFICMQGYSLGSHNIYNNECVTEGQNLYVHGNYLA